MGTLDDVDGYNFEVWAIDGSPDTFRIRIWTADSSGAEIVVYDNDPGQELTKGKVKIRPKKKNNEHTHKSKDKKKSKDDDRSREGQPF